MVELSDSARKRRNSKYPNVYVGETGLTPETQFKKHKAGGMTAGNKVTKFGLFLRPDLYRKLPGYQTVAQFVEAESWLKAKLEKQGYRVWGGTRGMNRAFTAKDGT